MSKSPRANGSHRESRDSKSERERKREEETNRAELANGHHSNGGPASETYEKAATVEEVLAEGGRSHVKLKVGLLVFLSYSFLC